MSNLWVIKDKEGYILRGEDNKILFFGTPDEALRRIKNKCGNSPLLMIRLWKNKRFK